MNTEHKFIRFLFLIVHSGNPDCNPETWNKYSSECCSVERPCGSGEGDCDLDSECIGDLVCGKDNCGERFPVSGADCCQVAGTLI